MFCIELCFICTAYGSQREMESSWEEHNGKSGAQKSLDWLGSVLSKLPALLIYICGTKEAYRFGNWKVPITVQASKFC